MTLRELFEYIGQHPSTPILYFSAIPFAALLAGIIGKGEGQVTPWREFYALLIFGVCIPGIFAIALSVYFFLFERGSLMNADVLIQILPIVSMFLTLWLVRRNVTFEAIPGFGKLSSLMVMIGSIMVVMWLLDRTHIIAFSYIPIHILLLVVVGLLVAFRFAMRNLFA